MLYLVISPTKHKMISFISHTSKCHVIEAIVRLTNELRGDLHNSVYSGNGTFTSVCS